MFQVQIDRRPAAVKTAGNAGGWVAGGGALIAAGPEDDKLYIIFTRAALAVVGQEIHITGAFYIHKSLGFKNATTPPIVGGRRPSKCVQRGCVFQPNG